MFSRQKPDGRAGKTRCSTAAIRAIDVLRRRRREVRFQEDQSECRWQQPNQSEGLQVSNEVRRRTQLSHRSDSKLHLRRPTHLDIRRFRTEAYFGCPNLAASIATFVFTSLSLAVYL